jgi:hypothetical protein
LLGAAGFHLALPLLGFYYRRLAIYRSESRFSRERCARSSTRSNAERPSI